MQDVLRVYKNIEVLLQNGRFQGSAAEAVFEAIKHIQAMIVRMESESEEQAGSGVGNAENTGGVASSPVPATKRKSRGGKGKRA